MTIYEFNSLHQDEQANIIWTAGVHIYERKINDQTVLQFEAQTVTSIFKGDLPNNLSLVLVL
jgi:hypothetical protein